VHPHPDSSPADLSNLTEAKALSEWREMAIVVYAFAGGGRRVPSGLGVATDGGGSGDASNRNAFLFTRCNAHDCFIRQKNRSSVIDLFRSLIRFCFVRSCFVLHRSPKKRCIAPILLELSVHDYA
jgi:hypothetical protein